jgi:methanogenic corrinoid protein MtbC1
MLKKDVCVDCRKESVLSFVSAVGDIAESDALDAAESLASEGMGARDIQKALELGMRIVDGKYRRGEYFIADRLYADRLYARIMDLPRMRVPLPGAERALTVILGSLPGDFHDAGNEAAVAALRARGFRGLYIGMDATPGSFERAADGQGRVIVALHCAAPRPEDGVAAFVERIRREVASLECLAVWGDEAYASIFRTIGADAYAEDVLALVDLCLAKSAEAPR